MLEMKKMVAITIVLLSAFTIYSESFLSIHGYPQNRSEIEDYQMQIQTKTILRPFIKDFLYPVFGFPAMVTENDKELSIILRHENEPEIKSIKITRIVGGFSKVFTEIHPVSVKKEGIDIYRIKCEVPVILPSARYDLTVTLKNNPDPLISWNSVFFPEAKKEGTSFYVWSDPQIEDLQSKMSNLNFNSGEYPFKSDSLLDFSRQEGIIKATVSQMNSGDSHFVAVTGDLVFGINYQREYEDILSLITNFEIPFFPVPGNHDGYAKFTDQNDFSTPLEWDGLEYWTRFFGPLYYAFSFEGKAFLMLNTYEGTPERRAAGNPVGLGDNAAIPVTNWGGFQTKDSLDWVEKMIGKYDVFGAFGHALPLGLDADGKYQKMKRFPKESLTGALDSFRQEWNIETTEYDSDPTDLIFNETQKVNTGLTLASYFTTQIPAPIYFAGHTHWDRIYKYESGQELVPGTGVFASDSMEFVITTTASTKGESYWGFRKVEITPEGEVSYNYDCEKGVNCLPHDVLNPGFQSIPAGNMWVTYKWTSIVGNEASIFIGGDNLTEIVSAEIVNYLPTKEPVTLRFLMPALRKGYILDNEDFEIFQTGLSKDLKTMIIVVKGAIDAGSKGDEFLYKLFDKNEVKVSISPDSVDPPSPDIDYSPYILSNEKIIATVNNSEDYLSIIWERDGTSISQGKYLDIFFEDYKNTETIIMTYIAKNGAFGQTVLNINIEEYIEELDEEIVEEPDETEEPDEFIDEAVDEEPDMDEIIHMRKKKGCSVLVI
jgi:3',5'-cyclic AMP phosphodiesterase CpdA